jgi:hypothetical protein
LKSRDNKVGGTVKNFGVGSTDTFDEGLYQTTSEQQA